jgi:ATP-dependent RNA helicase DDX41
VSKLREQTCRDDYVPVKERKSRLLQSRRRQPGRADPDNSTNAQPTGEADMPPPPLRPAAAAASHRSETSLLKVAAAAKQNQPVETEREKEAKEEKALMASFLRKQALRSAQENAFGTVYTEPMKTGWTPPSWYSSCSVMCI